MTRRRFILTAVLLVCVAAVVVPHWRELCLAVGYERKSWDFPIHDYLKKRAFWLPGADVIIPDQVCWACKSSHHSVCYEKAVRLDERNRSPMWFSPDPDDPVHHDSILVPFSWRCTCPNPVHRLRR